MDPSKLYIYIYIYIYIYKANPVKPDELTNKEKSKQFFLIILKILKGCVLNLS